MEIRSKHTNTTTHRAVIRGVELDKLVAKVIAEKAGIDIDAPHVDFKVWIKREDPGIRGSEAVAEVEIIEDLNLLPGAAK